jgi:hypothetical protein
MLAVTLYNAAFHPQKGPLRRARFVHRLRRLMVTVREILDYTGLFILQYRKRKLLLFIRVILETKCTETVELHIVVTKILDTVHRLRLKRIPITLRRLICLCLQVEQGKWRT